MSVVGTWASQGAPGQEWMSNGVLLQETNRQSLAVVDPGAAAGLDATGWFGGAEGLHVKKLACNVCPINTNTWHLAQKPNNRGASPPKFKGHNDCLNWARAGQSLNSRAASFVFINQVWPEWQASAHPQSHSSQWPTFRRGCKPSQRNSPSFNKVSKSHNCSLTNTTCTYILFRPPRSGSVKTKTRGPEAREPGCAERGFHFSLFPNSRLTVPQEFAKLKDGETIYKLIGPVLLKQDRTDAESTVNGRLEFIDKEM